MTILSNGETKVYGTYRTCPRCPSFQALKLSSIKAFKVQPGLPALRVGPTPHLLIAGLILDVHGQRKPWILLTKKKPH